MRTLSKILIMVIVLVLGCQLLALRGAGAASNAFSLSISPSILQISVNPPAKAQTTVKITNKGTSAQTLDIIFKQFTALGGNGQIQYAAEDDKLSNIIKSKLKIYDKDQEVSVVGLAPDETKTLTLKLDLDKTDPHGDYYFSLLFISGNALNTQSKSISKTAGGIGTNIIISIGSKSPPNGHIEEFSTPFFISHGPVPFTLLLENTGDNYIIPKGQINISDMFGRNLRHIDILPQYILAHTKRYMTSYLSSEITASGSNQNRSAHNVLIWQEKSLFGIYTATAVIKLSDSGPIFTKSTTFLAIPPYLLFAISLFIFVLIGIYIRVRKKL